MENNSHHPANNHSRSEAKLSLRRLQIDPALSLPRVTEWFLDRISLNLANDDAMYFNDDKHYLFVGASALNAIMAALQLADVQEPAAILDFGASVGRVTRWLRAAFPTAALCACDIRAEDMNFCTEMASMLFKPRSSLDLGFPHK
jgi:hypothetical protein